ncbi:MAG: ATP-dependent helicase HrpB [Rhizobiales bacterium]|nr:ATP-dependent helicase HrpB [Hyphomicrobiales bacterium]
MSGIADRFPELPVHEALQPLRQALRENTRAVLAAPPGAGKTTLVPLDILEAAWCTGRIILIEPRRLAARAAARRMAAMLSEKAGETVGYRMRLDNLVSAKTRIEVVTEGVFTRMALDDPELAGISCVIFDEFHERALEADFGLALALDIQSGLREDLRLLVMSATLDVERVAALLETQAVVESAGRAYPVDIRHADRPGGERIEDTMVRTIRRLHGEEKGSILAFLPGQGEIVRTAEMLGQSLGEATSVFPLYGGLTGEEQDRAIRPAAPGERKVVLATPVAESSITIDGVTIVVDSGLVRQPVLEPDTGITRLETVRASRASADQRAGRAGRTAPGIAVRLWHQGQTAALPAFAAPQILASDLSGLILDCAAWGLSDPHELKFIDPPPEAAVTEARKLLVSLGALDGDGRITERGHVMRALPLPPRLAAMVAEAREHGDAFVAAAIAVLLTEQGLGGNSPDIDDRLTRFLRDNAPRARAARSLAARMAGGSERGNAQGETAAAHLAIAFPDRIARQRGGRGRFVMANGRGCEIEETQRLAGADYIVVADLTGRAARSRVLAAAELSGTDLEDTLAGAEETDEYRFDPESGGVRARRTRRLGAIVLSEKTIEKPDREKIHAALSQGLQQGGVSQLPFSKAAEHLRERVGFLRRTAGEDWPEMSDEALSAQVADWLGPFLAGITNIRKIGADTLYEALKARVGYGLAGEIDRLAPTHYEAPTGSNVPIRYDGDEPVLAIRVQELFGEKNHPSIVGGRIPLLLELLSPAHRPIQTTRDLPGFWRGSWSDVRSEMRGRYPKHDWPEHPEDANPTRRAKPRGG